MMKCKREVYELNYSNNITEMISRKIVSLPEYVYRVLMYGL